MLVSHYEDLFDFVEVTGPEMKTRYAFFSDESWRTVQPVNKFWLNVSGSPRHRKGTMFAKRWMGYDLLIWVRTDKIGDVDYYAGDFIVLHDNDLIRHRGLLGQTAKEVLEDAQWDSWLALLDHLRYIVSVLEKTLE